MTQRTDIHRKGAIIPGNYDYVLSYDLPTTSGGWPIPGFGINCELDRAERGLKGEIIRKGVHKADGKCCLVGLRTIAKVKWAEFGGTGRCTACGASYVYGEVWKHKETNEHIHVGHICAEKYGLLRDDSEFELAYKRHVQATAVYLQRKRNDEERERFLEAHPGLKEVLQVEHRIIQDIASRFVQYRSLSEKQIALVFKLADEVRNPKPSGPEEPEEHKVPAPEGRQAFEGEIVSAKYQDGYYGEELKITVKVRTPEGVWLAWGTCPSAFRGVTGGRLKGRKVCITGTLTRSDRDEHFAFFKRPIGQYIDLTEEEQTERKEKEEFHAQHAETRRRERAEGDAEQAAKLKDGKEDDIAF